MTTINGMPTEKDKVLYMLRDSPILHARDFSKAGIGSKNLTRMVIKKEIQRIDRGLYTTPGYIPGTYHSLIEASKLIKNGTICLLSALSYYEIGTQNPSVVWIALNRKMRVPRVKNHPIRIAQFSGKAYEEGRTIISVDSTEIHIYNIPKTIADCFKYRNKIGLDVAIEALKEVLLQKKATMDELIYYAEICRVKKIMTTYMEAII